MGVGFKKAKKLCHKLLILFGLDIFTIQLNIITQNVDFSLYPLVINLFFQVFKHKRDFFYTLSLTPRVWM